MESHRNRFSNKSIDANRSKMTKLPIRPIKRSGTIYSNKYINANWSEMATNHIRPIVKPRTKILRDSNIEEYFSFRRCLDRTLKIKDEITDVLFIPPCESWPNGGIRYQELQARFFLNVKRL